LKGSPEGQRRPKGPIIDSYQAFSGQKQAFPRSRCQSLPDAAGCLLVVFRRSRIDIRPERSQIEGRRPPGPFYNTIVRFVTGRPARTLYLHPLYQTQSSPSLSPSNPNPPPTAAFYHPTPGHQKQHNTKISCHRSQAKQQIFPQAYSPQKEDIYPPMSNI
jgi:hypothetical protein